MVLNQDYVDIMISDNHVWKLDLMDEDPMGFLARPPQSLPRFSHCTWVIQVAILNSAEPVDPSTTRNVWRPRSVPALAQARALLLLKKKQFEYKTQAWFHPANWELPQGDILSTDTDVESALRRVVSEKTGLTVNNIMGGFSMLVVLDAVHRTHPKLKLFFAVTVAELTSCGNAEAVSVLPGQGYIDHQWVRQKPDVETISPVSPLHLALLGRAWNFRPEVWQSPPAYLYGPTAALPYHDRYDYLVAAVITREITAGTGRQLLLKSRLDINGREKWELPGGYCDTSYETVAEALYSQVLQEAGLHVETVLGQCRAQPLISFGWREMGSRSVVILPYEVSVKIGAVSVQEGWAWRWVQTKKDISSLRLTTTNLKLISAALDWASISTSVGRSSAEQPSLLD